MSCVFGKWAPVTTEPTLFGLPGDEDLESDIQDVWDRWADDNIFEEADGTFTHPDYITVEEWSVCPTRSHMQSPESVIEATIEWTLDNDVSDGADESWERAGRDHEVVEAFDRAMDVLASKVHYMQADKKIAEHVIWIRNGKGFLKGHEL
jgi:hypothetical protein